MRNCLIAQSGGPTAVINSSVIGVFEENRTLKYFDNVFAGLNGIEGILNRKVINLCEFSNEDINKFKYTPSSGLGSCRYKMKDFNENAIDYINFFNILDELEIDTFFYVGGNDSMDTVAKLSDYANKHSINKNIIGIPKTIDNDLMYTDHTPGFGSAAKLISTVTLETYLDSSVYINNGIFILETMGRDTGWLAASSALAKINGKSVADFIYLPEVSFSIDNFLLDVEKRFKEQNKVYIVASEGIKDEKGRFISETKLEGAHDNFGHAQLGGVCSTLKDIIIRAGITSRVKAQELGVIQRCSMHSASIVDIDEAFNAGAAALKYATQGITGHMIGIRRLSNSPYKTENFIIKANLVCNKIKYFPTEWITSANNHITDEALKYFEPLIGDSPNLYSNDGLPSYLAITKDI